MTTVLHETLAHPALHPTNLAILRGKKAWLLHLDLVVLADAGNVYDALFMAARAALCDTRVPRTRSVEYQARKGAGGVVGGKMTAAAVTAAATGGAGDMDIDEEVVSGFDTRQIQTATDFELPDYWDEGEPLAGREVWPLCATLNIVRSFSFAVLGIIFNPASFSLLDRWSLRTSSTPPSQKKRRRPSVCSLCSRSTSLKHRLSRVCERSEMGNSARHSSPNYYRSVSQLCHQLLRPTENRAPLI